MPVRTEMESAERLEEMALQQDEYQLRVEKGQAKRCMERFPTCVPILVKTLTLRGYDISSKGPVEATTPSKSSRLAASQQKRLQTLKANTHMPQSQQSRWAIPIGFQKIHGARRLRDERAGPNRCALVGRNLEQSEHAKQGREG